MSLPPELRKKIKLLVVAARKKVNANLLGQYKSAFKGQGMTFSDFREYVPGDDVRKISWPLMARTGKLYLKKYEEEREQNVVLAVDVSGSLEFGSRSYVKGEALNHLAALVSYCSMQCRDNIGLLLFSDQIEKYIPPKKSINHIHRILRELYFFKPKRKQTNISVALSYLLGVLKKKSVVFIMSDFMDGNYSGALKTLSRRHEVYPVLMEDELECAMPSMGLVDFEDQETGEVITVDTSSSAFKKQFKELAEKFKIERAEELKGARQRPIFLKSDEDFVDVFINFIRKKSHA